MLQYKKIMMQVNLIFAIIMSISLTIYAQKKIITGAERLNVYLPLLEGKKVGIMVNQTAIVGDKHLVDVLLEKNVDLKFAFIPEHGFRGTIERGEDVHNDVDTKTGLPLYSLYGENHQADSLVSSVDIMIFDIQDVGARFSTFS